MQDNAFEWDDDKAARNWLDHGVSFEMAREAFNDPFAVEWEEDYSQRASTAFGCWRLWKITCSSSASP